jgi:hypothetical protein
METFTDLKQLIAGSAMQLLQNYCQENVFVKSLQRSLQRPCGLLFCPRRWRVRTRRLTISTEVTLHCSSDRESVSHPHLFKITHPWAMFRNSLEHPPRYCVRRRLGSKTNCHWLSLTLLVSNAYSCNRKFPGDYENEVNVPFPGTAPLSSSRSWRLTVA